MAISNRSVLCVYRYDPLDRLADCSPAGQGGTRFFYQKNLLATQIQGQIQHTLLRTDEHLLARLSVENNASDCLLLATDQQQSVIAAQDVAFVYTPYGHRHPSAGPMNLPGYTGQRLDPVTGHYLLGNGYRAFNPVLMRFNSPDSLSPFGEGGVNAYGYCGGDPVNWVDPTGHIPAALKPFLRSLNIIKPSRRSSVGEIVATGFRRNDDVWAASRSEPQLSRNTPLQPEFENAKSAKELNKRAGLNSKEAKRLFKKNDKIYTHVIDRAIERERGMKVGASLYDQVGLSYAYDVVQKYHTAQRELFDSIKDLEVPPSYEIISKIAETEGAIRRIRQQI